MKKPKKSKKCLCCKCLIIVFFSVGHQKMYLSRMFEKQEHGEGCLEEENVLELRRTKEQGEGCSMHKRFGIIG